MTDVPAWLSVMRTLLGTKEVAGASNNPVIIGMADEISRHYPDMKSYCDLSAWDADATPWCGLSAAYCMAEAGVRPPFGATDTDKWGWAKAWADDAQFGTVLGEPRLGCVVVLGRQGGGHVTFYERTEGDYYACTGGNQGDAITTAKFPKSDLIALVWPREAGPAPPAVRRVLSMGDAGEDVTVLQKVLGIPADGDFGSLTDTQVEAFQAACGVEVDGVVGPQTWAEVDSLALRLAEGSEGLSTELVVAIDHLANESSLADHDWPDRGRSPSGYLPGMCLAFAVAYQSLRAGGSAAAIMAKPLAGADTDALEWFAEEFDEVGIGFDTDDERLRALFTLAIGLGMRESSGNYSCGRDTSAGSSSQTADTCEAGLFQMSWNASNASPEIGKLLAQYWTDPHGFLDVFADGITPTAANLACVGKGDGVRYQFVAKYCPLFACLTTAITLRVLRKHYGPVNRHEVTIEPIAEDLLYDVQRLVDAEGTAPVPVPPTLPSEQATVDMTITGPVLVKVNGLIVLDTTEAN